MTGGPSGADARPPRRIGRRRFIIRGATVGLAAVAGGLVIAERRQDDTPDFDDGAFAPVGPAQVAVLRATSYDDLEERVLDGLRAIDAQVSGRTVLIKPNLVEFDSSTSINTDPRLIGATVLALRRMGATAVTVGEAPGHRRDTDYIVTASGLDDVLREVEAPFVDLNVAPIVRTPLSSSYTNLGELWLPRPLVDADIVLSMPKLKAHHWVGVTLSLKNLFGCLPGRVYGWPKNVLHWQGIPQSILDIAGAVRPSLVIVDGIVGMEGDGPIMGTPVDAGHLVFSTDPVAADTTAALLMGVDPERIDYLAEAGRFLGQADVGQIEQIGEDPESGRVDFELIDDFAYLRIGSTAERPTREARDG